MRERTEQEKLSAREMLTSTARIMTLCLLVVALFTQARAESGQYKIRSLDLRRAFQPKTDKLPSKRDNG